jgi:hypothetical protein
MQLTTGATDLLPHRALFVENKKKKAQAVTVKREVVSDITAYGKVIRIPFPAQQRAV